MNDEQVEPGPNPALSASQRLLQAERRRLADLLSGRVIGPLNLLLAQADIYEQVMARPSTDACSRTAIAVLTNLARQALEQARDMEAGLRLTILETAGLEAALENLTGQVMRTSGLRITLAVSRLDQRLPAAIELALFYAAQTWLDHAAGPAHASQADIQLERRPNRLTLRLADNGIHTQTAARWQNVESQIEPLGGQIETDGHEVRIFFALRPPVELTPRETAVLRLAAQGLSDKEISQALAISTRTVNFHLNNLYTKLGVHSRTEAALYAWQHGHIPD